MEGQDEDQVEVIEEVIFVDQPAIEPPAVDQPGVDPPVVNQPAVNQPAEAAENENVQDQSITTMFIEEDDVATPSNSRKRKRNMGVHTPNLNSSKGGEEDDGLTCPICLDCWEMSGPHRLVSLKCGHLFGDACIRRWLVESGRNGMKCCPQCKAKAVNRDIRCIYAKRLRAIDRTEEHKLREELEQAKCKVIHLQNEFMSMKMSYKMTQTELKKVVEENSKMKRILQGVNDSVDAQPQILIDNSHLPTYKLFMERNIEVSKDPGCRVMVYSQLFSNMLVSQKSSQLLFPGFGVRVIDVPTFRPTTFVHTSMKTLRDIGYNGNQFLVATTSMEPRAKVFDTRTCTPAATFAPSDKNLWSCSFNRGPREDVLYLGAQHGVTYAYDMRFPENILQEFKIDSDLWPVINVAPIMVSKSFPHGGFVVCQLQSVWIHEYIGASTEISSTKLNIKGPFISMSYDPNKESMVLFTRANENAVQSRYIYGNLEKIDNVPIFNIRIVFYGSRANPVMSRCSQILVENNTLICGYIQDTKMLSMFDVKREVKLQSMPVHDIVYDTCPVYAPRDTYLAALTEKKCRIYKVDTSEDYR